MHVGLNPTLPNLVSAVVASTGSEYMVVHLRCVSSESSVILLSCLQGFVD